MEMVSIAERWFKSLKVGDYKTSWDLLTSESKERIIKDIIDKAKAGEEIDIQALRKDFEECGSICKVYWSTFVQIFNPDLALEESTWEVKGVKGKFGEIVLRYKNSKKPAILKMFREGDSWRLGLAESFWTKKKR